jgi:hypothetical protein
MNNLRSVGRKAQEEMVGFVMIVVIVAIISLVFLGIAFRQPGSGIGRESKDLSHFLTSTMQFTTDCSINYAPSSVGDLIRRCAESAATTCDSSTSNVCSAAQETIQNILQASWDVGANSPYKGYKFESFYNSTNKETVVSISEGNCSSNFITSEYLMSGYSGTIISSFKLCA